MRICPEWARFSFFFFFPKPNIPYLSQIREHKWPSGQFSIRPMRKLFEYIRKRKSSCLTVLISQRIHSSVCGCGCVCMSTLSMCITVRVMVGNWLVPGQGP